MSKEKRIIIGEVRNEEEAKKIINSMETNNRVIFNDTSSEGIIKNLKYLNGK